MHDIVAFCPVGLERILAEEARRLGLVPSDRSAGRVTLSADGRGLALGLMALRTADRLLLRVASFDAPDFDSLFEGVRKLPWERWAAREDKVSVGKVRSRDSRLSASTAVQSVVHKAVYARLGQAYKTSRLPETGAEREIRVDLEDDRCEILVDLSGEALSKRGWRTEAVEAPLRETVAAGLLFLSGWTRKLPLRDPYCGSGTIAIEAALYALDKAPNLNRAFAWQGMPCFEKAPFESAREELSKRVRNDVMVDIVGSDRDPAAVGIASRNAERAGVGGFVRFAKSEAADLAPKEGQKPGVIFGNPPYGLRIGSREEAEASWREAGSLRERFPGWSLGFIVNAEDFPAIFGAKPATSRKIAAGNEPLWFHWFPADSSTNSAAETERRGRKKE